MTYYPPFLPFVHFDSTFICVPCCYGWLDFSTCFRALNCVLLFIVLHGRPIFLVLKLKMKIARFGHVHRKQKKKNIDGRI